MIKRVQFIRHIKSAADLFLGLGGEITVNTTDNAVRVHDGATLGGHEMARKDVANVPPATGATDGKMTASQAGDLSTVKSDLTAHIGAGGAVHADAIAGGDDGFMTGADKTKIDGIESAATADQTGAEILAALLPVDGVSSGLDADLLDGFINAVGATFDSIVRRDGAGRTQMVAPNVGSDVANKTYVDNHLTAAIIRAFGFFDTTNDGAGSGLDADLLDGQQPANTASGNTVVKRDSSGRTKFVSPSASDDAAIKSYVDARLEAGTKMLFYQANAPTGWTKDTDQNNKALRVVSGTGGGTGGATAFTSVFGSGKNAGNTQLTAAQSGTAAHSHTITFTSAQKTFVVQGAPGAIGDDGFFGDPTSGPTATNNSSAVGATSAHNHSLSLDIQYLDVIKATKNA